jgi:hypothetical protein
VGKKLGNYALFNNSGVICPFHLIASKTVRLRKYIAYELIYFIFICTFLFKAFFIPINFERVMLRYA